MTVDDVESKNEILWNNFKEKESLSDVQLNRFKCYCHLMCEWNERINLTTITSVADIILYHFQDSLSIGRALDLLKIQSCADVGTGAGFPGLALAIRYPHLHVYLIEVTQKKIRFLTTVIEQLGLANVTIVPLDWLTVLRTCSVKADLVCARASLHPEALVTMFDSCKALRKASLVYWASQSWQPTVAIKKFITREFEYIIGEKTRKLIFFKTKLRS